jgi:hypothetical protein
MRLSRRSFIAGVFGGTALAVFTPRFASAVEDAILLPDDPEFDAWVPRKLYALDQTHLAGWEKPLPVIPQGTEIWIDTEPSFLLGDGGTTAYNSRVQMYANIAGAELSLTDTTLTFEEAKAQHKLKISGVVTSLSPYDMTRARTPQERYIASLLIQQLAAAYDQGVPITLNYRIPPTNSDFAFINSGLYHDEIFPPKSTQRLGRHRNRGTLRQAV